MSQFLSECINAYNCTKKVASIKMMTESRYSTHFKCKCLDEIEEFILLRECTFGKESDNAVHFYTKRVGKVSF